MKKILTGILFVVLNLFLFAEEAPHSMGDLLQRTQLIVHGKITSHTQLTATVHVIEILHNYRTGINQGDYLKIENDFRVVCPIDIPLEFAQQKKEAVFFLSYFKNKWYITMGDVAFFKDGKAELTFFQEGYTYSGTIAEWKSDLNGYYAHFKRNEQKELRPLLDKKKWAKDRTLSALAQLQYRSYYRDHFRSLESSPRLKPIETVIFVEEEPFATLASSADISVPISQEEIMEISQQIASQARERYPELVQDKIEGFTYYSLFFIIDGSIAKVEFDISVHGRINEAIQAYYDTHSKWSPALDEKGNPIRFKQQLSMHFKIDKEQDNTNH